MGLLYADGFDLYADYEDFRKGGGGSFNLIGSTTYAGFDTTNGRYGGGCLWIGASGLYSAFLPLDFRKTDGASPTLRSTIYGQAHVRFPTIATENSVELFFGIPGIGEFHVRQDTGRIFFYDANLAYNGTNYAHGLTHGSWHVVSFSMGLGDSATIKFYVDGSEVASWTDDTKPTFFGYPTLRLGSGYAFNAASSVGDADACIWDDVIVWDDIDIGDGFDSSLWASPAPSMRISAIRPASAGSSTQLTASGAATNHEAVDDTTPDENTTYVESGTSTHKDLYGVGTLPYNPATIYGLQVRAHMTRPHGGDKRGKITIKSGSEVQAAAEGRGLYTFYETTKAIFQNQPSGSAWDKTSIEAMEIGIEVN